jgi:hypothetical protein
MSSGLRARVCGPQISDVGSQFSGFDAGPNWRHLVHYNHRMANLTLVYGMRLLPSEELAEVGDATLKLKNGREAHVTMHVLEGSREEIENQLKTSLEAFFDFYPEI